MSSRETTVGELTPADLGKYIVVGDVADDVAGELQSMKYRLDHSGNMRISLTVLFKGKWELRDDYPAETSCRVGGAA